MSVDAVTRPPRRPRVATADLSGLLLASMEEVVRIAAGEVLPSRVHTAKAITAAAGCKGCGRPHGGRGGTWASNGTPPSGLPRASWGSPRAAYAGAGRGAGLGTVTGLAGDYPILSIMSTLRIAIS